MSEPDRYLRNNRIIPDEDDPLFESNRLSQRKLNNYDSIRDTNLVSDMEPPTEFAPSQPKNGFEFTPKLKKSKTFMNSGDLYDSQSGNTINRPSGIERRFSYTVNFDELRERVSSLQEMRSKKLIGNHAKLYQWENCKIETKKLEKLKNNKLKNFYIQQNELIIRYCDVDRLLDSGIHVSMLQRYNSISEHTSYDVPIDTNNDSLISSDEGSSPSIVSFAIRVNLFFNIILLFGKSIVVYMTMSMSVLASLVDSVLDLLSTLIIMVSNKYAIAQSSKFPIGRKRLEPIGILVFSVIIVLSFFQVAEESLSQLLHQNHDDIVNLNSTSIGIMIFTIAVKLIAYLWCISIKNSSVQALAEDAKTDIVFNFFSIIFPFIGHFLRIWWIDAFGALVLCIYVIYQWIFLAFEHINKLTGSHADKEDYQQILYLTVRFADTIKKITNFKAYHVGDFLFVEIDIVFANDIDFKDSHDIAEALQYAIETLPYVERCFVHIDYREGNFLGHNT